MRSRSTESRLQSKCKKLLEGRGWKVWVLTGGPYQESGVPDLLALQVGIYVWFEMKDPLGKLTPIQKHAHKEIKEHGGGVAVIQSVHDLEPWLRITNGGE